jgi:hypothetical protein
MTAFATRALFHGAAKHERPAHGRTVRKSFAPGINSACSGGHVPPLLGRRASPRPPLDCGGKRSATPLWMAEPEPANRQTDAIQSGVAGLRPLPPQSKGCAAAAQGGAIHDRPAHGRGHGQEFRAGQGKRMPRRTRSAASWTRRASRRLAVRQELAAGFDWGDFVVRQPAAKVSFWDFYVAEISGLGA